MPPAHCERGHLATKSSERYWRLGQGNRTVLVGEPRVCCAPSCGQCGEDRGCSRRQGGAGSCCTRAILRRGRSCAQPGDDGAGCLLASPHTCSNSVCLDPRLPDAPSAVWLHSTNASAILERSSYPIFPNRSVLVRWQRRLRRHVSDDARMGRKSPTCAVVGSSGALLHHEHGEEIDSAAAVFRINAAPTRGFHVFVGSRTSIRIWGARRWPEELNEWWEDRAPVAMYCQPTRFMGRCWNAIDAEPHSGQLARPRLSPLLWEEAVASNGVLRPRQALAGGGAAFRRPAQSLSGWRCAFARTCGSSALAMRRTRGTALLPCARWSTDLRSLLPRLQSQHDGRQRAAH